jgi:hypothetical protein
MIIGITGLKGSGKDTVAKMIQYSNFMAKNPESCKNTTIEDWINPKDMYTFNYISRYCDVEIKKFAGKLKQIICVLTGCSMQDLEEENFKSSNLPSSLKINQTYRWLLQKLGTEAIRDNIDKDIWINSLMSEYTCKDIAVHCLGGGISFYPNWVISDVRFLNEAKAIKDEKGIILHVTRFGNDFSDEHRSENEMYNIIPDFCIGNNGSLDKLYDSVKIFLKEYKLI